MDLYKDQLSDSLLTMYKWEKSCELYFSFLHFEVIYMYHNFLSMIVKIK